MRVKENYVIMNSQKELKVLSGQVIFCTFLCVTLGKKIIKEKKTNFHFHSAKLSDEEGNVIQSRTASLSRFEPLFLLRDEERMLHLRLLDRAVRRLVLGAVLLFQVSSSECLPFVSVLFGRSIEFVLTTPLTDCRLEARFKYKNEGLRGGTGLGFLPPVNNPL